jgi:hypothetical protein
MSATELQTLRGCMKKDPKAYADELSLQIRHFEANLEIFRTRPSRPSQVGHRAYRACSVWMGVSPRVNVRVPRYDVDPDGWDTCPLSSPGNLHCFPRKALGEIPEKQRPCPHVRNGLLILRKTDSLRQI